MSSLLNRILESLDFQDFETVEELETSLRRYESEHGSKGTAYHINSNQVLKVTDDRPYITFATFCYTYKGPNTLYPKVYRTFYLNDGTFCCIMEKVRTLLKDKEAYYIEELVELMYQGEEIPRQLLPLMGPLKITNEKIDDFTSQVFQFGLDDIQVNNMGRRKDGSLVIFDPVK